MGVLDFSPVGLPSSHAPRRLVSAVRVVGAAEDGRLTVMLPGGGEIDIAAQPGRYEVGATAVVDTDSSGRVVRAVAAASDIPDGAPVVDVLPSARLDAEARAAADAAAALAEQAGVDLATARAALEEADADLDERLASARDDLATLTEDTIPAVVADVTAAAGAAEAAQADADAAQADADAAAALAATKASTDWLLSRGTDLVTNGTGYLGDRTNFSTFTAFDTLDTPTGARGAFDYVGGPSRRWIDELIPHDPAKSYLLRFQVKQKNVSVTSSAVRGAVAPVDAYGLKIAPLMYMYRPGTTTTLAQPLRRGDTKIHLGSVANWANSVGAQSHWRSLIFWDYTDQGGRVWPKNTYSREYLLAAYADGAVSAADNSITLSTPWAGKEYAAGHPVSNGGSGGDDLYVVPHTVVSGEWVTLSGVLRAGVHDTTAGVAVGGNPSAAESQVPPGTAQIRVGWLLNYPVGTPATARMSVAAVSFSDVTAAMVEAHAASSAASEARNRAHAAQQAADSATTLADAAQQAADAATTLADAAKADALAARSVADAATTSAQTAQQAAQTAQAGADQAARDAASAAGLAGSKGETIFQPSPPTGTRAVAQNLWIDTTGGKNTPHRWDTSQGKWVPVTDKAATDAAAAAVAAQAKADQAAGAAAAAQSTADQAKTVALAAQGDVNQLEGIVATVDGKVTISAADPTSEDGAGKPTDAIWEVRAGSTVLRRYLWSGTAWTQVALGRDLIGVDAIGSAQIADAAVGSAEIADASIVTAKIGTAAVDSAKIKNLAVTDAKISNLSLGKLIAGAAAISTAVIEKLYTDVVKAKLLTVTDKIITRDILADGAVSARALNVTTEDTLDPATGRAVSILPDGVRLFVQDAEGGLRPVTGMTTAGEQYYYVLDHAGDVLAGISSDGDLTAQNAAVKSLAVDGRSLPEVVRDEQTMQAVANGWNTLGNTRSTTGELFLFNVTFPAKSGKYYFFVLSSQRGITSNGEDRLVGMRVRVSGVGSLPNQSSNIVAEATTQTGGQYSALDGTGIYFRAGVGEILNASLSLFIDPGTPGTVTMVAGTTPRLTIFEMGGGLGNIGVWRGDDYPASGQTPAPPPTVERQTVWSPEQVAQSFEVYRSTGAPATGTTAATNPLAGQSPYWTADNHPRTHIFFNLATLRSQMSGSDTIDSRVWFKVAHTYANAGGTLVLHAHNHDATPGSFGATRRELWRGTVKAGQAYDLRLGPTLAAEIRDGLVRGLSLIPADTSATSYLYLTWGSERPKIQTQYTK